MREGELREREREVERKFARTEIRDDASSRGRERLRTVVGLRCSSSSSKIALPCCGVCFLSLSTAPAELAARFRFEWCVYICTERSRIDWALGWRLCMCVYYMYISIRARGRDEKFALLLENGSWGIERARREMLFFFFWFFVFASGEDNSDVVLEVYMYCVILYGLDDIQGNLKVHNGWW